VLLVYCPAYLCRLQGQATQVLVVQQLLQHSLQLSIGGIKARRRRRPMLLRLRRLRLLLRKQPRLPPG
jgi:hypothetical protein